MTSPLSLKEHRLSSLLGGAAGLCIAMSFGVFPAHAQTALAVQDAAVDAVSVETPAPSLNRSQIDALLAKPDQVLFLDVRRADEISAIGGFPAFLNIQVSELDRFLAYIPRDRGIVTISNHAGRAKRAADLLSRHGFRVIGAAGAQDYAAEGGELTGQKLVTAALPGVFAPDTRIEIVREGFEGTEGPISLSDGSILFTENRADRIVRIAPDNSFATYLEKTGSANALAVKASGELVAVQTAPSGIAVLQPAYAPLATRAGEGPFNRPNDLAVSKAGHVYFTDPGPALQPGQTPGPTAVYWLDAKGEAHPIARDIRRPNGIALSPDEKTLYVANTGGERLVAFTVRADGSVADRRDFAKLDGLRDTPTGPSSGADGITVDAAGRVYVATTAGVQIFSPLGEPLGIVPLPKAPQNLAFGGPERSHLYVVGRGTVYRIQTLTRGVDRPGK